MELNLSYKHFLNTGEIARAEENLISESEVPATLINLGLSEDGNLVRSVKFGNGRNKAIFLGFVHPNEPVGSLVMIELSKLLTKDKSFLKELDFTFYMINVVDPDGAKLNEGWFHNYQTIREYVKGFYRPIGSLEFDSSFPIKYKKLNFKKPTREANLVANLIKSSKPNWIFSMHNSVFKGAYSYTSLKSRPIIKKIGGFPKKYGLEEIYNNLPDASYVKKLSQNVFLMPTTSEIYNYSKNMLKLKEKDIYFGGSSYEYANKIRKANTLINEVPIYKIKPNSFLDEKISRHDMIRDRIEKIREICQNGRELLEQMDGRDSENKLVYSVKMNIENWKNIIRRVGNVGERDVFSSKFASRQEKIRNYIEAPFNDICVLGTLSRVVKNQPEVYRQVNRAINSDLKEIFGRGKISVTNINSSIKMQMESILFCLLAT